MIAQVELIAKEAGEIALRPYLNLSPREAEFGRFSPRQIAIHTSGASATFPMRNKEWIAERFQQVADALVILGANALVRLLGNQATADFLETLASELRLTQSVMIH